ncbi:unnamed protein product [Bursaphelenchus okinawaensis]|uniref:non-specific serine/threonine protein kinase n=1 Tax=Bursaphelenchus okinawaensis TaxID=465554 RepID=A0A811KA34_9BILA|nr:unnamed protein product [Bursaphelenchus okinawaensis]CAG9098339.1 unnamed protein product [Bursaphelenchus okinawaensis]
MMGNLLHFLHPPNQYDFGPTAPLAGGFGHSASNMHRIRNQLGHSDPQLYTYSQNSGRRSVSGGRSSALHLSPASAVRFRKASAFVEHNRSHRASILSAHNVDASLSEEPTSGFQSTSNPSSTVGLPKLPSIRRRRRPLAPVTSAEGSGSGNHGGKPRSGSSLAAPYLLHHGDNRRWSLASLPSSSGYGTPGSISALSSEYSSQEQLPQLMGDPKLQNRYDSNDSYPSMEESQLLIGMRPRSRSLSSPVRFGSESGAFDPNPNALSQVYKERFPKAKAQMEAKLQQFLHINAPLSGFTSPISFDRPTSPLHLTDPSGQHQHRASLARQPSYHRPSSPCRPSSPIPRPISPLAMADATAAQDGKVVFRSTSGHSSQNLQCTTPYGNSSSAYYFPGTLTQQNSQNSFQSGQFGSPVQAGPSFAQPGPSFSQPGSGLSQLGPSFAQNSPISTLVQSQGPMSSPHGSLGQHHSSQFGSLASNMGSLNLGPNDSQTTNTTNSTSRRSTMAQCDAPITNPTLLRVLAEGATRFIHHQVCEIAADCLQKSRDDQLTSSYFCQMSIRLEESLAEANQKTSTESFKFLAGICKQLLMIVSRAARLLESLEFDPDEFYRLLEETEGALRYQLGAGNARVPDLPQYIIDKLGLNKNLMQDRSSPPDLDPNDIPYPSELSNTLGDLQQSEIVPRKSSQAITEDQLRALTANAPKEDDFESIRLISNGAYGAVYLVRHYRTRQRFALKKMKKQTLLLRNQVDQVYAERDILTFTDNPFVVSFYGSFETKQHLCMLMEYVEGGDCASLLKSAGVLPIEVARLYVAETVLAIEYLHSCGIVHRDLKPDNLLITSIGHIKLTDFGLSKIGLMNRTTLVSEGFLDDTQQFRDNQLCGTPEYIAPEVILRQGYGKPVDWWALGIILYEFLVGIVPFLGGSPEELFTNIINEEVEYPDGEDALEPNAENLIQTLLEKNPVDRLGTVGGAPDVASHPFFQALDFNSLLRQKAEFVPNLENEEDTSYFDSRTDRYNHDAESGDDETVPMFWSFSTASPRHSITAMDISMAQLAQLNAAASPTLHAPNSMDLEMMREKANEEAEERGKSDGYEGRGREEGNDDEYRGSSTEKSEKSGETIVKGRRTMDSFEKVTLREQVKDDKNHGKGDKESKHHHKDEKYEEKHEREGHKDEKVSHKEDKLPHKDEKTAQNDQKQPQNDQKSTQKYPTERRPVEKTLSQRTVDSCASGQRDSGDLANTNSTTSTAAQTPNSCRWDDPSSPSAILLRQRFSAARQNNHSTSSSGTTGTGPLNTCSSTDSSMDASFFENHGHLASRRQTTNFSPLPRFAISSCDQMSSSSSHLPQPQHRRATLSAEPEPRERSKTTTSSPTTKRTESLKVVIPGSSHSLGHEKSASQTSIFYHAAPPHASPDRQSQSSLSSFEPNSPQPPRLAGRSGTINAMDRGGLSNIPDRGGLEKTALDRPILPDRASFSGVSDRPSTSTQPTTDRYNTNDKFSTTPSTSAQNPPPYQSGQIVGKPVVIRKGAKGFGFTIRSVRVYLSADSDYYTIEHIVAAVREGSPADEAGLKENDLITHVHTQPVHNMTHPQLMHRLLSGAPEITLHVVPLNSTSIKEGEARRSVGKLLRKKPRRPQRRVPLEKKTRKTSALFRRLSGKRGNGEIVPGASTQKQSFMPRSASSQDGVALSLSPAPMSHLLNEKRLEEQETTVNVPHLKPQSQHRRSSGHQLLHPQGAPSTSESTRRKHTTGSIDIREPHGSTTVPLPPHLQGPRPGMIKARTIQEPLSTVPSMPSTPSPAPPPTITSPLTTEPSTSISPKPSTIRRPSTLIERKPSSNSQNPDEQPRPRPTDLRKSSVPVAEPRKVSTMSTISQPTASTDEKKASKTENVEERPKRESIKRPPVPTRKLSPSRLVQRLFRAASSASSSSTQLPSQKSTDESK